MSFLTPLNSPMYNSGVSMRDVRDGLIYLSFRQRERALIVRYGGINRQDALIFDRDAVERLRFNDNTERQPSSCSAQV